MILNTYQQIDIFIIVIKLFGYININIIFYKFT